MMPAIPQPAPTPNQPASAAAAAGTKPETGSSFNDCLRAADHSQGRPVAGKPGKGASAQEKGAVADSSEDLAGLETVEDALSPENAENSATWAAAAMPFPMLAAAAETAATVEPLLSEPGLALAAASEKRAAPEPGSPLAGPSVAALQPGAAAAAAAFEPAVAGLSGEELAAQPQAVVAVPEQTKQHLQERPVGPKSPKKAATGAEVISLAARREGLGSGSEKQQALPGVAAAPAAEELSAKGASDGLKALSAEFPVPQAENQSSPKASPQSPGAAEPVLSPALETDAEPTPAPVAGADPQFAEAVPERTEAASSRPELGPVPYQETAAGKSTPADIPVRETVRLSSGQRVEQEAVMNQVLEHLSLRNLQGGKALTVRLHPQELGELKLDLVVSDDRLRVHIQAQTSAVRDVLDAHLPRLREALEAQGLRVGDLQLSLDTPGNGGFDLARQFQFGQDSFRSGNYSSPSSPREVQTEAAAVETVPDGATTRRGGLSLRV
ncbi:MAG: flagellar hook-length control protein FliK [Deltaproteobacteria bacterium]|nr:flagellar hook-length control protein FliK [Deltaproteobacteria bacterium]